MDGQTPRVLLLGILIGLITVSAGFMAWWFFSGPGGPELPKLPEKVAVFCAECGRTS